MEVHVVAAKPNTDVEHGVFCLLSRTQKTSQKGPAITEQNF